MARRTPDHSESHASKRSVSVSGNVGGDLSVEHILNQTINHITSASDNMSLDGKAFEFMVERDLRRAIEPFAEELQKRNAELALVDEEYQDTLALLEFAESDNAKIWRRLRSQQVLGVFLLVVGVVITGVVASALSSPSPPTPAAEQRSSPASNSSPSSSSVQTPSTMGPSTPGEQSQMAFETPSGNVVCSTYSQQEKMGCLITSHEWGEMPKCKYYYTLASDGPARITACPDEEDLSRLLTDMTPNRLSVNDYDVPFNVGVATCVVNQKTGTMCKNSSHHFRISKGSRDAGPS